MRGRLRPAAALRCPRHPAARRILVHAMSDPTPGDLPAVGLDEYRNWRPESQARALELLTEYENSTWQPFYCQHADCDGNPHGKWDWQHARADQRPPQWWLDWLVWLLKGGRGSGKTRTGSEVTHRATEATPRVALIAATGPDLREIMVEGESGILATAPPGMLGAGVAAPLTLAASASGSAVASEPSVAEVPAAPPRPRASRSLDGVQPAAIADRERKTIARADGTACDIRSEAPFPADAPDAESGPGQRAAIGTIRTAQ